MAEYLDFDEYESMGGTVSEEQFPLAYARAKAELDRRTFGRLRQLEAVSDNVKHCLVELVNACHAGLALYDSPDGVKAVQSASNDGVSVSYAASPSASEWFTEVYPKRVMGIIDTYLSEEAVNGMNVLYRGVCAYGWPL